jgi:hypothetical protein
MTARLQPREYPWELIQQVHELLSEGVRVEQIGNAQSRTTDLPDHPLKRRATDRLLIGD